MSFESLNALLLMQCLLSQFCVLSLSVYIVVLQGCHSRVSPLLPGTLAAWHLFARSLRGTPSGGLLLCAVCVTCVHGFCVT